MQYHLDTIPVWEAMEKQTDCPICALLQKTEEMEIERSLGGSVMEPDTRIRVNRHGFCQKHHQQLFRQKNRLGHALLTDSHTKELLQRLDKLTPPAPGGFRSFLGSSADVPMIKLAEELEQLSASCVVCDALQTHMNRYFYTFLHLWKKEAKFKAAFEGSRGVCVPHAAQLLRHGQKHLSQKEQRDFSEALLSLLKATLSQDEKDLEWFTLKFDYRNQDKPWGNSKDALERTVNRLRGHCLGDEG